MFITLLGDDTFKVLLKIERLFAFSLLRRVRDVKLLRGWEIYKSLVELIVTSTSLLFAPTSLDELLDTSSFSDFSDILEGTAVYFG